MGLDTTQALTQVQTIIDGFVTRLPNIAVALALFGVFYLIALLVRSTVRRIAERYLPNRNLAIVLARLGRWSILVLGILIGLVIIFPDFSPSELLQLLGISGVAVGFAFRDILQNFVAGVLILLSRQFQIGDQIIVSGYEGTITNIETRATTIETYDHRHVVLPNTELFTKAVTVNTAFAARRIEYDIGIAYPEDIEEAKQVILEAIRGLDDVEGQPAPQVLLVELGSYSVVLRARWWISPARRAESVDTRDQVLLAIKHALDAADIVMPFPTRAVLVKDHTDHEADS